MSRSDKRRLTTLRDALTRSLFGEAQTGSAGSDALQTVLRACGVAT